jgi:GPI-anchor transamidase subunit U
MSTEIFSLLFISISLYFSLKGNIIISSFSLSFSTYLSVYPILLITTIPLLIKKEKFKKSFFLNYFIFIAIFSVWLLSLLYISYLINNKSLDFINVVYWRMINIKDLTPNYGIFWYIITEMFDYFRNFFIFILNTHFLMLLVPFIYIFQNDPFFLNIMVLSITQIFKPYPVFLNLVYYMNFYLIFNHLFQKMQYGYFYSICLVASVMIGPFDYNSWIYKGTTNANFFYNKVLLYMTSQVLIFVEFMKCYYYYNMKKID